MLTIVIATYERGAVLCDTIAYLLSLPTPADEIVVVDQTPRHQPEIARRLSEWAGKGVIRLMTMSPPSIPRAMNAGLRAAQGDVVLFVDDDIIPTSDLAAEHVAALRDPDAWACVGQVLQPGEEPGGMPRRASDRMDLQFAFNSTVPGYVENVIACNLSVHRLKALSIGGFDERFIGVAYRFETDFARRIVAAGGRVRFEPSAAIRHLKAPGGGTRSLGDHKSSPSPMHSVGDYYFAIRHVRPLLPYVLRRLRSNVLTRFHLRHPWTIPSKLTGEFRGMLLARKLHRERGGE